MAALAGIIGLSISSVMREQERLVDDFTQPTRQQVHASVEALSARLDALDQDTRMLTDLVEHSGDGETSAPGDRAAASGRRLPRAGRRRRRSTAPSRSSTPTARWRSLASDPAETADTVAALIPHTRRLAGEVVQQGAQALGKTARIGDRSFLLYGTPVRGGRAIVVASDAAVFLGAVAWTPLPDGAPVRHRSGRRGLGGLRDRRRMPRRRRPRAVQGAGADRAAAARQIGARGRLHRPADRIPAVQVSERVDRPTGSWVVTWLASTRAIVERQSVDGRARGA